MPQEDAATYDELKKVWDNRGDKSVHFTLLKACGKEKYISARTKE